MVATLLKGRIKTGARNQFSQLLPDVLGLIGFLAALAGATLLTFEIGPSHQGAGLFALGANSFEHFQALSKADGWVWSVGHAKFGVRT